MINRCRNLHEFVVVGYKEKSSTVFGKVMRLPEWNKEAKNPDNDPRGGYEAGIVSFEEGHEKEDKKSEFYYSIETPSGRKILRHFFVTKDEFLRLQKDGRIYFPKNGEGIPRIKIFQHQEKEYHLDSLITGMGTSSSAKNELLELFDNREIFSTPKPTKLLQELIRVATDKSSIILDSFAGSGTTAHAVLNLNKEDGGNRKFILVEMEDYANNITAERVRRVIKGVPNAKDEKLKQGLGGSFTFCKLGDEFNIEKILTGETLPKYESLANYVFYTATGKSLETPAKQRVDYFVGETDLYEVYLIYQADIAFLRSNESALNSKIVEIISNRESKKQKLVFASAKYMGQNELNDHRITFCQLPYAIHKIAGK